jgi:hypothetical protein
MRVSPRAPSAFPNRINSAKLRDTNAARDVLGKGRPGQYSDGRTWHFFRQNFDQKLACSMLNAFGAEHNGHTRSRHSVQSVRGWPHILSRGNQQYCVGGIHQLKIRYRLDIVGQRDTRQERPILPRLDDFRDDFRFPCPEEYPSHIRCCDPGECGTPGARADHRNSAIRLGK